MRPSQLSIQRLIVFPHTLDLTMSIRNDSRLECDFGPASGLGLSARLPFVRARVGARRSFVGQPWARPSLPSVGRSTPPLVQRISCIKALRRWFGDLGTSESCTRLRNSFCSSAAANLRARFRPPTHAIPQACGPLETYPFKPAHIRNSSLRRLFPHR